MSRVTTQQVPSGTKVKDHVTDFGHRGSTLTLVRVYPDFGTVDYNMCMIVHYLLAPWRFEKSINEYVVLAWFSLLPVPTVKS